MSKILVLTPDLPGVHTGGIATYVGNTLKTLDQLGHSYELIHWGSLNHCKKLKMECDILLNMHCWGGLFSHIEAKKRINFLYSGELIPIAQNPVKTFLKKILYPRLLNFLSESDRNIFISQAASNILQKQGFELRYDRDIIHHPCIDVKLSDMKIKSLEDDILHICSIARDVPHKNLKGVVRFCELLTKLTGRSICLHTTASGLNSNVISIESYPNANELQIREVYQKSHLNLLLSLDHSHRGFVEGYGQTPLEAAEFKVPSVVLDTGGLPEAVHHLITGYVLSAIEEDEVRDCWAYMKSNYGRLANESYKHLVEAHTLKQFTKFMETVL